MSVLVFFTRNKVLDILPLVGGKRGSGVGVGAPLIPWKVRSKEPPVNSGGWRWKGEGVVAKVYLHVSNYKISVIRIDCSVRISQ